jgi:GTPase SAR1 family protein
MSERQAFPPIPIHVVAAGDATASTAHMLLVLTGQRSPENGEPTLFGKHRELRTFEGRQYCLYLYDTPVQPEYPRLREGIPVRYDVILFCFALNSPETLKNVTAKWFVKVPELFPKASALLVGTKSDLWDKTAPDAITQAQIDEVAAITHAYKFILCSAKKNEGFDGVFDLIIQAHLQKNPDVCNVA